MMFLKFVLLGVMFSGCGGLWDDEKDEAGAPSARSSTPPTEEKIFMEEKLGPGRNWLISDAGPGDRLVITLAGTERPFKLNEEVWPYDFYVKMVEGDNCYPHPCPPPPSYPNCFFRHQSIVIGEPRPFLFSEDSSTWPLKIEVNGEFYPPGEVIEHKGTEVTFEFVLREEMMDEDLAHTGIYLVQIGPREDETVRAGFLEFVDPAQCPEIEEGDQRFELTPHYAAPVMGHTATLVIKKGGS